MVNLRPWNRDSRKIFEKVLGDSTVLVLSKLIEKGKFDSVHGEVARGKESCVFIGLRESGAPVIIKIYRVETAVFQDIMPYITGDDRFSYFRKHRSNRALVFMWAKKEYSNLLRLKRSGLSVPLPYAVLENVLVMEFFGDLNGAIPARTLKDEASDLSREQLVEIRDSLINDFLRKAYWDAGLIHADLSEYNVLIEKASSGKTVRPVVIDCAQAVLKNHPSASEFLMRDCTNISKFFYKILREGPSPQEVFERVTAPSASVSSASTTTALQDLE